MSHPALLLVCDAVLDGAARFVLEGDPPPRVPPVLTVARDQCPADLVLEEGAAYTLPRTATGALDWGALTLDAEATTRLAAAIEAARTALEARLDADHQSLPPAPPRVFPPGDDRADLPVSDEPDA